MAGERTMSRTFRPARWLWWTMGIAAPAFAAGFAWLAYDIAQERLAGRGWQDAWAPAIVIATLCGLVLLFLSGFAHVLRAKLTVGEEGVTVRGILRTRAIPWKRLEGYRWIRGRMNVYAAGSELPIEIAYFEDRDALQAILGSRLRALDAEVTEREAREIREDLSLGLTQAEKDAALAEMRRLARALNWSAYVAAGAGGVSVIAGAPEWLQTLAAGVLITLSLMLLGLALSHPNRLRLDYREGSIYPEGASGLMGASMGLGAMAALDPHTLLGGRLLFWVAGVGAAFALAWITVERERLAQHMRSVVGVANVLAFAAFSAFWASGAVVLVNRHADFSQATWSATRVEALRTKGRSAKSYLVRVAPWGGMPEAIELEVPRKAYRALKAGMDVEVVVRAGALDIPWVETIRPARRR